MDVVLVTLIRRFTATQMHSEPHQVAINMELSTTELPLSQPLLAVETGISQNVALASKLLELQTSQGRAIQPL